MVKIDKENFELLQKVIEYYQDNVGDWMENCILSDVEYVIEKNYVE